MAITVFTMGKCSIPRLTLCTYTALFAVLFLSLKSLDN